MHVDQYKKLKTKTKPGHPEEYLQKSCVTWFKVAYPKEIILSIPNGAYLAGTAAKRAYQWRRLLDTGALPGCPDLLIAKPNKINAGLFVEMKFGKNKPSPEQVAVIQKLTDKGYRCNVCYSLDEFMRVVGEYMKSTFLVS